MTSRRHLTFIAAAATLLAVAPISAIFSSFTWAFQALIMVGLVTGAALGARALRMQVWAQLLAMLAGVTVALTLLFGEGTAIAGLIPTPDTFAQFEALLNSAGERIQTSYVPAPDDKSLLFVTSFGIGAVAVLVDLFAVGLRRPALAGLPMLAIYSVPVAVYTESVSPLPFIVGAIGYMWLLVTDNVDKVRRFGRRFTGEGRGVDLWEPSPLAAAGRRLAVFGVVVAVVLPIAVPGMTAGFFAQFGTAGQGQGQGTGSGSGSVNLFAMLYGQLNQTQIRELVKVTTTDPNPFYLRFGTADDIRLDGFANRAPIGRPVGPDLPRPVGLVATTGVTMAQYNAKVEVFKEFVMPMLPVYYAPIATRNLNSNWNYDVDQQVIYSTRANSSGARYEFDFIRPEFTPDQLRTARALPQSNPVQRGLTTLPIELPTVRTLVDDLTEGKTSVYDRVRALYDYFSQKNGFAYDLTVPEGSSGQKITDFLQNKRGFCQQYAAALAWMVRAAGIPARVAFGFTKGSNYTGGVYTLTNRNLHAWTEVYFDGFGWVPFDATPSASVAGAVTSAWAPNVDAPPDLTPTGPALTPRPTDGADPGDDPRRTSDPNCPECGDPGASGDPPTPAWVWWSIGGALLVIVLFMVPALRRQSLRRRRSRGTTATAALTTVQSGQSGATITVVDADGETARRQAHAAWDELIDTMIDYRIVIDPAETPRSTAERLISGEGLATAVSESTRRLGFAEEKARYSLQPAAPQGLMAAVTQVRQSLAAQANRWVRFCAVMMPPSVIQLWRRRISAANTSMSNAILGLSLRIRRILRPLRLRRAAR